MRREQGVPGDGPPGFLVERMVGRSRRQGLAEVGVGSFQVVVGKRREEMVESVVPNGEGEEQAGEEIAAGVIAGIEDVILKAQGSPVAFKVMIGQETHLI